MSIEIDKLLSDEGEEDQSNKDEKRKLSDISQNANSIYSEMHLIDFYQEE